MNAFNKFRGRLMTIKTAAKEVEASESTIHRYIKAKKIQVVRLSEKNTRICGDSLADFLTASLAK